MIVHLKKIKSSAIFSVRLSGVEAYLWHQPSTPLRMTII
ncbi:hypothetical protein FLACHUCJ7_01385 [Flavobacterium chungangense]|uniref:Uncharacterized protein n=1 Tax=Flavobacterium chungangense TaxID=554283 RepID=A0A6V6YVJ2_9FLAO|nr:hypothetical protein FLACHUCJ7_01385 [Flavobacterium chungangense]